jgi:hypothetical protein
MHNKIRPFLPAIPYLVGVALQVSGVTHIGLAVAVFEVAALIAAAVAWSYWVEWHQNAAVTIHGSGVIHRVLAWPGLSLPRFPTVRPQWLVALLVFFLWNGAIGAFVNYASTPAPLAPNGPTVSENAPELAQFFGELGGYEYAKLPKGMSDDDYMRWGSLVSAEIDKITAWMRVHMSPGAEFRFADFSEMKGRPLIKFTDAVNERHNREKNMILLLQENLKTMMATTTWDKKHGGQN